MGYLRYCLLLIIHLVGVCSRFVILTKIIGLVIGYTTKILYIGLFQKFNLILKQPPNIVIEP